jgi:hypothetical protein
MVVGISGSKDVTLGDGAVEAGLEEGVALSEASAVDVAKGLDCVC